MVSSTLFFSTALLGVSSIGLAWSTIGGSLAGYTVSRFFGSARSLKSRARARALADTNPASPTAPLVVDLLIAAHNEEAVIGRTLESLQASVEKAAQTHGRTCIFRATVGLDHCTDGTAAAIATFVRERSNGAMQIRTIENTGPGGKWNILGVLASQSAADWVAFVDSGSIWEAELLSDLIPSIKNPTVAGVAPSYSNGSGGGMESLNWRLEQSLKKLENRAGGPVSVHGATVFYRRSVLDDALASLRGTSWLNDDVVLPLTIRIRNPLAKIVYMVHPTKASYVGDCGVRAEMSVEYRRRRRMVAGNIQWIDAIWIKSLRTSPAVALLASRRVARVFWAYWALGLLAGAALGMSALLSWLGASSSQLAVLDGVVAVAAIAAFASSNWIRRLSMAFFSGLQIPQIWRSVAKQNGVSWV